MSGQWSGTLDDIAMIRARPGMYAGPVPDGTALDNLVLGTVAFAIARARSLPSFETKVFLHVDASVTVCLAGPEEWDGDSLSLLADARSKAATSIYDCIRLEPDVLDLTGGVYCDLCVVNALSDWMCDQAWSGATVHAQMFRDGIFEGASQTLPFPQMISNGLSGLSTTFLPSRRIFPSIAFDATRLQESISALCDQNMGARVSLVDER